MADTLTVTSPHDGSIVGEVPLSGAAGVEAALATAYGLYRNRDG